MRYANCYTIIYKVRLIMTNKIASVNIFVPFKGPGNIIRQNSVAFDVYSEDGQYKAIPALNEDERRIANLPHELHFHLQNGKVVSGRGDFDGNFHAIEDIVRELQKQKML